MRSITFTLMAALLLITAAHAQDSPAEVEQPKLVASEIPLPESIRGASKSLASYAASVALISQHDGGQRVWVVIGDQLKPVKFGDNDLIPASLSATSGSWATSTHAPPERLLLLAQMESTRIRIVEVRGEKADWIRDEKGEAFERDSFSIRQAGSVCIAGEYVRDTTGKSRSGRNLQVYNIDEKGVIRPVEIPNARATQTAGDFYVQILLDSKVLLICDNLNTHTIASFYEAFEPERARALVSRLEFHHTPEHGSWLNVAECELSVMTRQAVPDRVGDIETLRQQVAAWKADRNRRQTGVDWQFRAADARIKLKSLYPQVQMS